MHAKHVLPGFKDRSGEERDIEAMTQSITRVRACSSPRCSRLLVADRRARPSARQDFRKAQDLIKRIRPEQASEAEHRSTLNLQRGLAAKVQDLSAGFRKKQRSYMESASAPAPPVSSSGDTPQSDVRCSTLRRPSELQGHASKSESLLKTSGAAMLMSREQEMVALEDDLQAVSSPARPRFRIQTTADPRDPPLRAI